MYDHRKLPVHENKLTIPTETSPEIVCESKDNCAYMVAYLSQELIYNFRA